ncbi:MAG: hypothetical protein R3E68_09405 [Burkholderiaceae bacterium]
MKAPFPLPRMVRALRCGLPVCLSVVLSLPGLAAHAQDRGPATPGEPNIQIELGGHAAPVRRLAVSAARGVLVTASDDKTARIWDLATRELRQILRPAVGAGETGRLYGAAIHPTEDLVAVAGSTGTSAGTHRILLFSLSGGALVRQFDAQGGDIKDLAYSADGRLRWRPMPATTACARSIATAGWCSSNGSTASATGWMSRPTAWWQSVRWQAMCGCSRAVAGSWRRCSNGAARARWCPWPSRPMASAWPWATTARTGAPMRPRSSRRAPAARCCAPTCPHWQPAT